jgi:alanine racemase
MTDAAPLTRAYIYLNRLTDNLHLLRELAGERPVWPAVKANAYGHGMELVARHLFEMGCDTLCVAHVSEAETLVNAGVDARFLLFSATLPEHSEAIVRLGCEPAVCTLEFVEALARDAQRRRCTVTVHLMVDTGMGRIGIRPEDAPAFLERCASLGGLRVRGLMTHFPCADETDKTLSLQQIDRFRQCMEATRHFGIEVRHMANSAAIFDLPDSHCDAVRPGIAIYGLPPSRAISNPRVRELKPVLEWKTRISFLKEVPAGTGLSYGHTFHTEKPSLIATVPAGYGDGLSRRLSNRFDMLVCGVRCPQVGCVTMDQSLVDVTALRGRVALGDEVVIIGRQGDAEITADELAEKLGTINYEIVTSIAARVPRVAIGS